MCDCIAKYNKELERHGMCVPTAINFSTDPVSVFVTIYTVVNEVEGRKPRGKKPALLIPDFCPFCGESQKLPLRETEE